MRVLVAGMVTFFTLGLVLGGFQAGEARYSVKDVMRLAHKNQLFNKVADGKASADDKRQLLDLYIALNKSAPPKGDAESWKRKTGVMVEVARRAANGDPQAARSLKAVVNCAACHKEFRK